MRASPAGGIGVEGTLRLPVREANHQAIQFGFTSGGPTMATSDSIRRLGDVDTSPDMCAVGFPGGEGAELVDSLSVATASNRVRLNAPSNWRSGRPMTVRVQLFEDGRCGVAIDGRPVWMSRTPLSLSVPRAVFFVGNSARTDMTIGALDAWQGVKTDMDWSAVDPLLPRGGVKRR
ncbi:MAG: hypothetical protein K2X99_13475 [Gemmatimonadaceae bacterium]|nr:hypothetical protein [Gemmatimonadaceae bacterium]